MKISILGNGSFGSGMASYFKNLGHTIISEEVNDSDIIFVAVPSLAVVPVLLKFKNDIKDQKIVICSKGFTEDGKLISNALEGHFKNIFFFYGPTLIEGIKRGELSGVVLTGGEGKEEIKKEIESDNLIVELGEDVICVQIGASLKNVMTILIGIADGAKMGENTKAFFFARGLQEIQKFGVALGAKPETFIGLSCAADLVLNSRNRDLGAGIGRGRNIHDIIEELDYTPEGIATLKHAKKIAEKMNIKTPVINALHNIIFENVSIKDAIKNIK